MNAGGMQFPYVAEIDDWCARLPHLVVKKIIVRG
jgi:hypothetical protein